MSGLFGGASKATTHATKAMGIDFQGAQYGPVVPVVYGQNRVPGNCVWYGDFQSHAQQQKQGKGGGGGGTTNCTYSASAQMGLCEGPGVSLVRVYDGTSVVDLSSLNYAFASGAKGQAPWSHLSGITALGYSLTAVFSFQNLDLGSQASLPNYNYEVKALKPFSASIPDANPADIVSDVCSDPYHGINFPYLGNLTQYSNYCVANGLFLSPVYDQQQSGQQTLSDLFKYTNAYAYYSDDQLKVVPLGDVAVTGNGVTFTPNVTPLVDLDDTDCLVNGDGDPPVTFDRVAPQDALNLVRVEFKDRSNTYHDSGVVGSIDYDVVANGERSDTSETVNGCTTAAVARFIAQNLVQRTFYIRNTYQFKLPWNYCYLEPTDIVTLTDASLGLNKFPVRITSVEEDGGSVLTIEAEEFPEGIGHSATYGTQSNGGTNVDQNADPGPVNPPYLFRGPGMLVSNNTPEIWCACNGSGDLWGACEVHLSHDGSSYTYVGTIASQARYGTLSGSLPVGSADPDVTNTPTVQLYAPAQLLGGSQTDADNFVTLAMVDTEIIGYETATLTAPNTYQLSYLRRGGYGSTNAAHSSAAPFVRLDDSIFRIPVDPSLIGSTVYLKFLSLNVFGRTPRTLAEETAYTYVVGTNVELPDVPDVPASFAVLPVADGVNITWTNDNPAAVGCTSIEYATASGGPWNVLAQVGPTTTAYTHHFTNGSTYYYRARSRGPLLQSGWSAYTSEISSAGKTVANGATVGATIGPGGNVSGAVDGSGYPYINFVDGGHLGKSLANIPDDPTSTRYAVSNIDGNRRALIDFTQTGHVAKNVDNIGDGITYGRPLLSRLNAGSPLIDFHDTFHLNKHLGNIPDDATSTRYAVSSIDSGRRALIDFTQSGHTGKSLANVPDDPTSTRFASIHAPTTQTGIYAPGQNMLPNPTGAAGNLHWTQAVAAGTTPEFAIDGYRWRGSPSGDQGRAADNVACAAGTSLVLSADMYAYAITGGMPTINISYHDASNAQISMASLTATANTRWTRYSLPVTTPAGTAAVQIYMRANPTGGGTPYWRNFKLESGAVATPFSDTATQDGNQLTNPGSGQTVGDQRNLLPVTWAGVRSVLSTSPISYSISGTTVNFSVAAVTVNAGGVNVAYNASSGSVSQTAGTTFTYYLYYRDATASGGTQSLYITTSVQALAAYPDIVNLGNASVTVASGGGGSGGTGSGGGGFCVADDMFIAPGRLAGSAEIGDPFDCIDLPTQAGKHVRALQGVTRGIEECVRMITSDGCALVCSVSTPFDLPDGRATTAPHMLGEQVITDLGTATVTSLALVGPKPVTRAHLGGVSYAAGADPHRRIYSHNAGISKP